MNLNDVQDLVERAKQRGMNPIERLDAMGLVLTDERHVQLAREVCLMLADRIEQESLRKLIGKDRQGMFPMAEVKNGIVAYIRRNFSEHSVEYVKERRTP